MQMLLLPTLVLRIWADMAYIMHIDDMIVITIIHHFAGKSIINSKITTRSIPGWVGKHISLQMYFLPEPEEER